MENDISKPIETATPTNNEEEEEDIIPVELVDEVDRFKDGYGDKGPQFQTYQYGYQYNNKNQLHGKGCCRSDRDRCTNKK